MNLENRNFIQLKRIFNKDVNNYTGMPKRIRQKIVPFDVTNKRLTNGSEHNEPIWVEPTSYKQN